MVQLVLLLLSLLSLTDCEEGGTPQILSQSVSLQAREGDTVTFPCSIIHPGKSVITWSWAGKLVSAGDVKVYGEERMDIVREGRELVLRNVTRSDRGPLTCTLNLKVNPINLNHSLEVLVPPSVRISAETTVFNLTVGERMEVRCEAEGYPEPLVRWRKQGSVDSGTAGSSVLLLASVVVEDAGVVTCSASNSEGEASKSITINVLYKPVVQLRRKMGQTGGGNMFSLVCSVQANPPAKVSWLKDGVSLRAENYSGEEQEETHFLSVKSVSESDYGNYSCQATNSIGITAQYIELKGQPDQPVITSPVQSEGQTYYLLSWQVWTPPSLPILNQSILYRLKQKANGATLTEEEGTWHNLALISNVRSGMEKNMDEYSMDLNSLTSDAEYEVRIRAMNKQGWSQLSQPFFFRTSGQKYHYDRPAFTKTQLLSGSSRYHQNIILLSLVLFRAFAKSYM